MLISSIVNPHRRTLAVLGIVCLSSVSLAQAPTAVEEASGEASGGVTREEAVAALGESPVAALLESLGADAARYYEHVTTLANPFFEGRAPGSAGNRRAADYVEFEFRRLGLTPAFASVERARDGAEVLTPEQSYRQTFSVGSRLALGACSVNVTSEQGGSRDLRLGTDFGVLEQSGSGVASGPLVFVGYSIDNGPGGYTSYTDDTDLTGKIAVVLRFEPMDEKGKSKWAGNGWSVAAELGAKVRRAAEKGAAGVILVNPPGADDPRSGRLLNAAGARAGAGASLEVPAVMIAQEDAEAMVRAADAEGRGLMDLRRLADEAGGVIDLPNAQARIETEVLREEIVTDNVGAVLAGRGELAGEYIIIGAHYDHIGYGEAGSGAPNRRGEVHPGADDNASGTSGLLLLASKLAETYETMPTDAAARSVIFLAFTAEESGLIGSRHYARNPSVPLDKVGLMLNMDMIGRLRGDGLEVGGANTAEGMEEWIKPVLASAGFEIKPSSVGDDRSDHASFIRQKVPALFFFTGLHREYHTPDDVSSLINPVGAVRVVNLVHDIAVAAAQRPERFAFVDPRQARRGEEQQQQGPVGGVQVRFGIAPGNYGEEGQGVEVADVYDGTTAAEAGLKKGDVMKKWNGAEVTGVAGWMDLLRQHKPGDQVEIHFERDGKVMVTYAVLKGRDRGDQ